MFGQHSYHSLGSIHTIVQDAGCVDMGDLNFRTFSSLLCQTGRLSILLTWMFLGASSRVSQSVRDMAR